MAIKLTWDQKYAPKNLNEYIFNSVELEEYINKIERIPNLLFYGSPGTGKTSLANILTNHFNIEDMDIMFINASGENGIDVIREKVTNFVMVPAFGEYKVVIFDESDGLTIAAQNMLKTLMDEHKDNASFIFTCNSDKMSPPIKSRCNRFEFKAIGYEQVLEHVAYILVTEEINFKVKNLRRYIDAHYPDIRHIIIELEQHSIDGVLLPFKSNEFNIIEYLENDDWRGLRALLVERKDIDYNNIYETLYKNLDKCSKFSDVDKYENGIIIIAGYVCNNSSMPMLNLVACIIELSKL